MAIKGVCWIYKLGVYQRKHLEWVVSSFKHTYIWRQILCNKGKWNIFKISNNVKKVEVEYFAEIVGGEFSEKGDFLLVFFHQACWEDWNKYRNVKSAS